MRYLSPTSLFDCPVASLSDKKTLILQRKKLLAELELSVDDYITIQNHQLSKSDILEYVETLQDETTLSNHTIVAEDKMLLAFLEATPLPADAVFAENIPLDDNAFLEWISPYFYAAFIRTITEYLQTNDKARLKTLLQNPLLMTEYDRERAWIQLAGILENHVCKVEHYYKQIKQTPGIISIDQAYRLIAEFDVGMIFILPQGPFSRVRDKYAFIIMQISIAVFNHNKRSRSIPLKWMETAKKIAVSEAYVRQIVEKTQEMRKLHKKSRAIAGPVIAILLVACRLIAIYGGNNSSSPTLIPTDAKLYYVDGKDTTLVSRRMNEDTVFVRAKSGKHASGKDSARIK